MIKYFICLLVLNSCNSFDVKSIDGDWKGQYGNHDLILSFNENSKIYLKYFDVSSNQFNEINGFYDLDFSKSPIPLSIYKISELDYSLHSIIQFIGEDSIRMSIFSKKLKLRPISFEFDKVVGLKKIK